jgi:iron complex outermembrane recepter protein
MKTNFLPFFVSMLALLSTTTLLSAQTVAAVSTHRTQATQRYTTESSPSLKTVLDNLQAKHGVNFLYKSQIGEQKIATSLPNSGNVEENLHAILTPNHLAFRKAGANLYAIMTADEAAKNAEAALQEKAPAQRTVVAMQVVAAPKEVAQTVNGTVKDATTGEVLTGVSVVVKGTTKGTATDIDGKYTLQVEPTDVLVFSFLGYTAQEVTVGDKSTLDVALETSDSSLSDVVVIGSRAGTARTDVERPVPVDILSAKELQTTGQVELGQQVQYTSPSFNSTKNAINGIANYADPASLKGLAPDQMLVLIEGKRYHQFAAIQTNVTVGKGTVVTDMNAVPSLALERLEILRDGAAAQYGSDAIAGIANLVLKKSVNTGAAQIQYGQTSKGDGNGYTASLNYGLALGKNGFLNLTGSYQDVQGSDRSDAYNPQPAADPRYTGKPITVPYAGIYTNVKATDEAALKAANAWGNGTYGSFHVGQYGSNAMKSGQGFYNAGYKINEEWSFYSFGNYSNKQVFAQAFLRTALPTSGTSNPDLYPNGYVPQLPGTSIDYSSVIGVKRKVLNGWNVDLSTGYGKNTLDQYAKNSSNASLGAASPKEFYIGRVGFGQSLTEANVSKNFDGLLGTQTFNIAFGSQFRVDNFQLIAGDAAASAVGPLATTKNKTPGSQGRVGIGSEDVTNKSRSNIGVYADIETDITDKLLAAAAIRYENYSDFGSNVSGKLAARLKLTENFAVRGSINKGFRAPLLQQIASAATTSTVQAGTITSTKQLPSSEPKLKQVGIEDPKPETSWNYNIGVTAKAGRNFLFTADAYQIDITDRIIITENLVVKDIAALKAIFPSTLQQVTFFTNAVNTKTTGVDVVAAYKQQINTKNRITASVAFTVNKTSIVGVKATPAALQLGTVKPILLIDTVSRALIETSQPHTKVLTSLGYQYDRFSVNLRSTYFGEVTGWEKPANLPHRKQVFAGKNLFDVSVVCAITKNISLTVGGNNVTNVYPDKIFSNYASYTNGQVPYTRNANQFGFNGAYYYANVLVNF